MILSVADAVNHRSGRGLPLVHVELAHRLLDQAQPVLLVVDDEAGREPHQARPLAQDAHAGGMEGRDEGRANSRGQDEVLHATAHLVGRLVGEGDGEYVARVHSFHAEEPGDAVGDDAGLAAARAREDEHGSLGRLHGLLLHGIERAENAFRGHGGALHR